MKKTIIPLGIILLTIFGIFMYINRFTTYHVSDIEGYVFATNDIANNLTSGLNDKSASIKFENVRINDNIYKSGKKFYIGEESKKNVNLDYPIVSSDNSSVLILSDKGNYVDETFVKSSTYKNTIIAEGTLYNGISNQVADENKLIFVELGNGVYVNLEEVVVKRNGEEIKIPTNSFVFFERSFLRYYTLKGGEYKFYEAPAINDYSPIKISKNEYEYYDFLIKLGVIYPTEDKVEEEIIEEILTPEEQQEQIEAITKPPSITIPSDPVDVGGNYTEEEYIKPEARISDVKTGVYSFSGKLEIYDPTNRVYKAPTIEFAINKQVSLRSVYTKSMTFETIGLLPDTEYEVTAYFLYTDRYDRKYKNTFYTGTIHTSDISKLETLEIEINGIKPSFNKLDIDEIKFKNKKTDEVLKGLKLGEVNLNDLSTRLLPGQIVDLAALKTINYETGETLQSGTAYDGEIIFHDIANNELKIKGNKFEFSTLKAPPKSKISVDLTNNFTVAQANVSLINQDLVNAWNFRYELYEFGKDKLVVANPMKNMEADERTSERVVRLENLKAETKYLFKVFCDYIDSDGSTKSNYVINEYTFTTYDAGRLGVVPFNVNVDTVTQDYAKLHFEFSQYEEGNPVYELLDDVINVEIIDNTAGIIRYREITKAGLRSGVTIDVSDLASNREYEVKFYPTISTSCDMTGFCEDTYFIPTRPETLTFKTDKAEARVFINNGFIADGYVDFDVCLEDVDGAIDKTKNVQVIFRKVEEDGTIGGSADIIDIVPKTSCTPTIVNGVSTNPYTRITSDSLERGGRYQININAASYNIKHIENTQTAFNEYINNLSATGTNGQLKLVGLTNEVNYKLASDPTCTVMNEVNLFDLSNNSRWKSRASSYSVVDKEVKLDNNELVLKAKRGYTSYSYYIPELQGKTYTLSYEYEYTKGSSDSSGTNGGNVWINAADVFESPNGTHAHQTSGSGQKTITINQTGKYLTIYLNERDTSLETTLIMRNIKIECGTNAEPSYSTYGGEGYVDMYAGEFNAYFNNLMEQNLAAITYPENFNELDAGEYKYFVEYYLNENRLSAVEGDTESSDLRPEEGETSIAENLIKREIIGNKNLEARLGVRVSVNGETRDYVLKTVKFSSEAETRTIRTIQEFRDMHDYGYYLVDLEGQVNNCQLESNQTGSCINFNGVRYSTKFQGSIDFQGNKVEIITGSGTNPIFSEIGGGGVVKNIDLHIHFENSNSFPSAINGIYGLASTNKGLISNINVKYSGWFQPRTHGVTYDEIGELIIDEWVYDRGHSNISLITNTNYGTIENFAIELENELIIENNAGLVAITNNGIIKNGYIKGSNINAGYHSSTKNIGIVAVNSNSNSRINNVYSLIDVVVNPPEYPEGTTVVYSGKDLELRNRPMTESDGYAAGIVWSANNAFIENAIMIDPRYVNHEYEDYDYESSNRTYTSDALVYNNSGSTIKNINFVGKENYRNTYTTDIILGHLKDGEFMRKTLNSDKMFNVEQAGLNSVFPTLLWNEFMPTQDPIAIPEVQETERLKVIGVNKITQATADTKFIHKGTEYFAEVKISTYNPQALKIVKVGIEGFGEDDVQVVGFTLPNTAHQQTITLYIKEPSQYRSNYKLSNIYLNSRTGTDYVNSYTKNCDGEGTNKIDSSTEFDCENKPSFNFDLYKPVHSINEINAEINNNHENLILMNDIDYSEARFSTDRKKLEVLRVNIDGNGKTIKNLTTNSCFIEMLNGGTIKNLTFENFEAKYNASNYSNYAGIICESSGGTVDNVHVKKTKLVANISPTGSYDDPVYIGGLIGKSSGTIVKNSSVTEMQLPMMSTDIGIPEADRLATYVSESESLTNGVLEIGGLIGNAANTDITNSFVRNLNLEIKKYNKGVLANKSDYTFGFYALGSAGGIAGTITSGKVENIYATGKIDNKNYEGTTYLGGLVGHTNVTITGAISYVSVYSVADHVGGVLGYTDNYNGNMASKTLALGDILTSISPYSYMDRTSGTLIEPNKNFAWNRQSINSKVTANTNMEELLNDEDLSNPTIYSSKIGLSTLDYALDLDNYRKIAYSKTTEQYYEVSLDTPNRKSNEQFDVVDINTGETIKVNEVYGALPKLINSDTGEILPNQELRLDMVVNYVELFSIESIQSIRYIDVDPTLDSDGSSISYQDVQMSKAIPGKYDVANYLGRVVEVVLHIRNNSQLDILGMTIEDMDIINDINAYSIPEDATIYEVTLYTMAKLNKNKDSYNISSINYKKGADILDYRATIKLNVSFYGNISNADDWNNVKENTSQNFAITGDVDFATLKERGIKPKINLSFNKLIGIIKEQPDGTTRGPVIKNFNNVSDGVTMGYGDALISTITSELNAVSFENIKLKNNKSTSSYGNYFGIIKNMNGTMVGHTLTDNTKAEHHITFKNIEVDGGSKAYYVGAIAYSRSPNMQYVKVEKSYANGYYYVGNLIGYTTAVPKYYISGRDLVSIASGAYSGGLIGYETNTSKYNTYYASAKGVYVYAGTGYAGGIVGYGGVNYGLVIGTEEKLKGYQLKNVITNGWNYYAGGVIGYNNYSNITDITAENLNISAGYYAGGVVGRSGGFTHGRAINCDVSAYYYAGGIAGNKSGTYKYMIVSGGRVNATYSNAGGIGGTGTSTYEYCHVGSYLGVPTTISGGYYVAGIVPNISTSYIRYCFTNAIISGTYYVGGLTGIMGSNTTGSSYSGTYVYDNIVGNAVITSTGTTSTYFYDYNFDPNITSTLETYGNKYWYYHYVGGIAGKNYKPLSGTNRNFVSATVKALNGSNYENRTRYVGYGYTYGGGDNYSRVKKSRYNADNEIEYYYLYYEYIAPYGDKFNNFVKDGSKLGSASNRVYAGSTLNGVEFTSATDKYSIGEVTETSMKTYASSYQGLTSGKFELAYGDNANNMLYFPVPTGLSFTVKNVLLTQLATPTDPNVSISISNTSDIAGEIDNNKPSASNPMMAAANAAMGKPNYHALPSFDVYTVDADKINIEFKEVDLYTTFEVNGQKYKVDRETFTFYYDFKEDFEIKLSDGINSQTTSISAEEIKNGTTVVGEYYYYIENGELITNNPKKIKELDAEDEESSEETIDEEEETGDIADDNIDEVIEATPVSHQSNSIVLLSTTRKRLEANDTIEKIDNATNIYGDKVLLDDQNIYDINEGCIKENSFENLTLVEESAPLQEFTYANQLIKTYYNYSTINGEKINKQLFLKNGKLEVIEQGIQNKKNQILIDNYNDKEYLVYLGNDGKLQSLKEDIEYPRDFKNANIKNISTNIGTNSKLLLVEYKDDSYVVFNYTTGQKIDSYTNKNVELIDYIKERLEIANDSIKLPSKNINKSYTEAKKLVEKLNKKSIDEVLKKEGNGSVFDKEKYVISYNPSTKEYQVYQVPSLDASSQTILTESLSSTIDEIINGNPTLIEYYKDKNYSKISTISSIFITIGVVFGILTSTIFLWKNYKKSKKIKA